MVAAGAVPPLLALLDAERCSAGAEDGAEAGAGVGADDGTRCTAAGVIANLATSPSCHATILAARALPTLLALAALKECTQTRLLVAGALANLMGNPQHKDRLAEGGVLGLLLDMCGERGSAVQVDSIRNPCCKCLRQ